jgi:hypothetical protein
MSVRIETNLQYVPAFQPRENMLGSFIFRLLQYVSFRSENTPFSAMVHCPQHLNAGMQHRTAAMAARHGKIDGGKGD